MTGGAQVSAASARGGLMLNKTAPEPRNGSTQRPCQSHAMRLAMKGVSFVLMPCVLRGGAAGFNIIALLWTADGYRADGPIIPANAGRRTGQYS